MAEVAAGIVVANLPPLRKSFDKIFRRVIPSIASNNIRFSLATYHSQSLRPKGDGESDKAILDDIELDERQRDPGIMKTTQITIGNSIGKSLD
jgi:hypothetical protein